MLLAFEVFTVFLVAVTMGLALAHVLEFPGKVRLDEKTYLSVQAIYYPGFTIGGIAEPLAVLATLALLFVRLKGHTQFWLILTALCGLIVAQIVFWLVTQPANRVWLRNQKLGSAGARFFSVDPPKQQAEGNRTDSDWRRLRNRWEYSHFIRAVLSAISLGALLVAMAM